MLRSSFEKKKFDETINKYSYAKGKIQAYIPCAPIRSYSALVQGTVLMTDPQDVLLFSDPKQYTHEFYNLSTDHGFEPIHFVCTMNDEKHHT